MTNIETLDLDDGVIARLDHDDARGRWLFRLIDVDAFETITTRVYDDEGAARAYLETWRNPLRQASWIA
jgi:hypothetical protein